LRTVAERDWKVELRQVASFADLPKAVREQARRYGKEGQVKGVLFEGQVYVVADQHSSVIDAETTILHEVKGHLGVHRLYGGAIQAKLNGLLKGIGGREGLEALARKRGFSGELKQYADALANSRFSEAERGQIMVEETLAHIAQEPRFLDRVKAIIGAIRARLRRHGFALAKLGETDLLYVLSQGNRRWFVGGGRTAGHRASGSSG
jgi:hypothetical protein